MRHRDVGLAGLSALLRWLALPPAPSGPNFKRPAPPADAGYGAAPRRVQRRGRGAGGDDAALRRRAWTSRPNGGRYSSPPKLDRLIEQALKAQSGHHAAQAALRQAHELYSAQRQRFLPTVQGGFSAQRAKNALGTIANPTSLPQANPYYNLYTAQLSVSYMPDVFGGHAARAGSGQGAGARHALSARGDLSDLEQQRGGDRGPGGLAARADRRHRAAARSCSTS